MNKIAAEEQQAAVKAAAAEEQRRKSFRSFALPVLPKVSASRFPTGLEGQSRSLLRLWKVELEAGVWGDWTLGRFVLFRRSRRYSRLSLPTDLVLF